MNRPPTTVAARRAPAALLVAVALAGLALGGCRGPERAAAAPTAGSHSAATGSDPLAGVEATVDAVERDLDADAGAAGR